MSSCESIIVALNTQQKLILHVHLCHSYIGLMILLNLKGLLTYMVSGCSRHVEYLYFSTLYCIIYHIYMQSTCLSATIYGHKGLQHE